MSPRTIFFVVCLSGAALVGGLYTLWPGALWLVPLLLTLVGALGRGLVVSDKAVRVRNYQHNSVRALVELLAAGGMSSPAELRPWHILRRVSPTEVHHYGEMYEFLKDGALLGDAVPKSFARAWNAAKAGSFESATPEH
jgi:hypothetical protein